MYTSKELYGNVFLELEDLIDTDINYPIELEYYKTNTKKNGFTVYGIEVIKKEYLEKTTNVEIKRKNIFTRSEKIIEKALELLKNGKVTPMGLKDSLTYVISKLREEDAI